MTSWRTAERRLTTDAVEFGALRWRAAPRCARTASVASAGVARLCTAFVRCAPLLCCAAFAGPAVDGRDVARNQPPPAELGAVPSCWRALGAGLSCREVAPAHQLRPPVATVDDVRTAPRSSSPPRRRWRLHHHRLSMTASRQGSAAAQAAPARATAPAGAVVRRRVPRSKAPTAKAATKPVASPMEAALAGLHRARPGSAFHTPDRHADGLAPASCLTAPPVPVPPTAIPRAPASAPSSTTPTPPPVPLAVPHPPPSVPLPAPAASAQEALPPASTPVPATHPGAASVPPPAEAGLRRSAATATTPSGPGPAAPPSTNGGLAAGGAAGQPGTTFWTNLAKGVTELLLHSRGVAGSLAASRSEVNSPADKYEAVQRELKLSNSTLQEVLKEQKVLVSAVEQLTAAVKGGTPEARNLAERELTQCRQAYADALGKTFSEAATTAGVWLGTAEALELIHSVVSSTLGLSTAEAIERVSGKRETTRCSTKDQAPSRASTKSTPVVKMFNDRRATFMSQLGEAAVAAWKERVGFSSDAAEAVPSAVAWLNADKYLRTPEGFAGLVDAVIAVFTLLGCASDFVVAAAEVGEVGHVRALLGHVSFVSTKVSHRGECDVRVLIEVREESRS